MSKDILEQIVKVDTEAFKNAGGIFGKPYSLVFANDGKTITPLLIIGDKNVAIANKVEGELPSGAVVTVVSERGELTNIVLQRDKGEKTPDFKEIND